MSKYYKAEDVIRAIAEYLAWNDNRINRGKYDCIDNWEEWIKNAEAFVYNLPTIEVSEDAISRENLIKSFLADCECESREEARAVTLKLDYMLELIDDAPSVIPQQKEGEWIPCSERLPSEQGHYFVTFPLCDGEPWVYVLSFNKGKFYETDDEWGDVEYDDVTAWMPLPEPWKGADDE